MKKPLNHIKIASVFNLTPYFILGLLLVILSLIASLFYSFFQLDRYREKHAISLTQTPLLLPKEKEKMKRSLEISAKAHLRDFIELFFSYNKKNYQERIERALWMGDDSIRQIYESFQRWYNTVDQNEVIQKISWEDPDNQIQLQYKENHTWEFFLTSSLDIGYATGEKKENVLQAKGQLKEVSKDFPLNPHGFLICNFSYHYQPVKIKSK